MRIFSISFCIIVFFVSVNAQQNKGRDEKMAWVSSIIEETSKIKSGMTRSDLLKVFVEEGGLSTGLNRTYVYRDCPLIKVDVEFEPVGRPAKDSKGYVTLKEDKRDIIKSLSKPYLDLPILD